MGATEENDRIVAEQKWNRSAQNAITNAVRQLNKMPKSIDPNSLPLAEFFKGGGDNIQTFELLSGKRERFVERIFTPEELENETIVREELNGRAQDYLNDDSLKDILVTLPKHQFYPAIASPTTIEVDGVEVQRIEFHDGSRRRKSGIIARVPIRALVSENPISKADAKHLANSIQKSVKAKSAKEQGAEWSYLINNEGLTNEDIAKIENVSSSTVKRALRANSVHDELIQGIVTDLNSVSREHWDSLARFQTKSLGGVSQASSEYNKACREHPDFLAIDKEDITSSEKQRLKIDFLVKGKGFKDDVNEAQPSAPRPRKKKLLDCGRAFVTTNNNRQGLTLSFGQVTSEQKAEIEKRCVELLKEFFPNN